MSTRRLLQFGVMAMLLAIIVQSALLMKTDTRMVADQQVASGPLPAAANGVAHDLNSGSIVAATSGNANGKAEVGHSVKNDLSPALRDMPQEKVVVRERKPEREHPPIQAGTFKEGPDAALQSSFGPVTSSMMPSTVASFEGIGFPGVDCNCAPPDTNGEAGLTQYVQSVNSGFKVWNKNGTVALEARTINSIWKGFGGACEANNDGDPIVLYDQLADRWLISQFTASSPYHECIAISTTADATGSYHRYAFQLSTTDFPDYPHIGIWPDGYYMSVNWFTGGSSYAGPRPYVFDRAKMLLGQPATFQTTSGPLGSAQAPIHPADLDGSTQPAAGSPGVFAQFGNPLNLYKFKVDWASPANTTWAKSASLAVATFTRLCTTTRSCIPQPSTSSKLDGIGDRLMHRVAYRNRSGVESLLVSHSASVSTGNKGKTSSVAAPRWYEVRNPLGAATLYQQGTFAPDSTNRWMSSIAMDKAGNIALGYSASSASVYPSIKYTGRLAGDPAGQMTQGEGTLQQGLGSQFQTGSRWGDYSSLAVDPADDCTFWYTSEYYPSGVSQFNWRTRIGSFKFPGCTP